MEIKRKTIIMVVVSILFGTILGWSIRDKQDKSVIYYPYYKFISHLNLNSAWVNIYRDPENDIAYYTVSSDMTDFTMPVKNEEVTFMGGDTGTIEEMSPNGFNVKVEKDVPKHGMSGTPCFNSNGEVIGYVSAAIGQTHIYCIWR